MLRVVIAAAMRNGLCPDEITSAIAERITPADVSDGQHVPVVRELLRGVWADRKAAPDLQYTSSAGRRPGTDTDAVVAAGPDPGLDIGAWVESVLAAPAGAEPDWTSLNVVNPASSTSADEVGVVWFSRRLTAVLEEPQPADGGCVDRLWRMHDAAQAMADQYADQPAAGPT